MKRTSQNNASANHTNANAGHTAAGPNRTLASPQGAANFNGRGGGGGGGGAAPRFHPQSATGSSSGVIVIAIVMGLAVVILTNVYIAMVRSEAAGAAVTVYRFNKQVEPGHILSEQRDLVAVQIPDEFADSIHGAIGPDNLASWDGQRLAQPAREGDPLTTALFRQSHEALDHQIGDGNRGVALPVNSRNTTGLLRPGMLVDILGTFSEADDRPRTMPVMQGVRVVAVGTSTDTGGDRPGTFSSITVEVEPEEAAALLTISRHVGRDGFDIAVRNPREDYASFVGVNERVKTLLEIE